MPRRVQRRLNVSNGSARAYDTQRPAICANGDCPIALTMGSQPSSNLGLGAGAGGISAGPLTATSFAAYGGKKANGETWLYCRD